MYKDVASSRSLYAIFLEMWHASANDSIFSPKQPLNLSLIALASDGIVDSNCSDTLALRSGSAGTAGTGTDPPSSHLRKLQSIQVAFTVLTFSDAQSTLRYSLLWLVVIPKEHSQLISWTHFSPSVCTVSGLSMTPLRVKASSVTKTWGAG